MKMKKQPRIQNLLIGLAYPLVAADQERLLSKAKELLPKGRHEILSLQPDDPLPSQCSIYFAEDALPKGLTEHSGLVWVQACSAGADAFITLPQIQSGQAVLTSASGIHSVHIAEFVLAGMINLSRQMDQLWSCMRERTWPEGRVRLAGPALRGRTVAILGYGSIGREVGRMSNALGMRVLAICRSSSSHRDDGFHSAPGIGDPEGKFPETWFSTAELPKAASRADFLAITCPLTSKTRGIVNKAVFDVMKPSPFLLNVGRGAIIDFNAMRDALQSRQIAGAALDVHPTEPLPPHDPLYDLTNVQVPAHMAGVMGEEEYSRLLCNVYLQNLTRFVKRKEMLNRVDPVGEC